MFCMKTFRGLAVSIALILMSAACEQSKLSVTPVELTGTIVNAKGELLNSFSARFCYLPVYSTDADDRYLEDNVPNSKLPTCTDLVTNEIGVFKTSVDFYSEFSSERFIHAADMTAYIEVGDIKYVGRRTDEGSTPFGDAWGYGLQYNFTVMQ